jgi:hypothetical protein
MMMRALRVPMVTLLVLMGPLAASAAAEEFTVSKLGKGKLDAIAAQRFKTTAGVIECKKASALLEFTALKFIVLKVPSLQYTECTAFGVPATVTPASYEFDANGTMTFAKAITIEPETLGCTIKFAKKTGAEKVSYHKHTGKLQFEVGVSALTYTASGGACGVGATNGEYDGTLEGEEEGGTFE